VLVLNRRAGESIVIEHGIEVRVLSVSGRKVWLRIEAPGIDPPVCVSATAASDDEARLEIRAPASASVDADGVRVEVGSTDHPSSLSHASLALNLHVGQAVAVGKSLRVGVGPMTRANPCLTIEGPSIGTGVRVTVIRPVGNYVRIGVEAPARRVYRKELWDDVMAAAMAAAGAAAGDQPSA
jgi:sRNA-binding carbon storage regulator CsrA